MRGSPPCAIVLRHFTAWRAAVFLIGATVLASLFAWALAPGADSAAPAVAAAAALGLAAFASAASLWRVPAGTLRWDGTRWSFVQAGSAPEQPQVGQLDVAIDLDAFMLLRLTTSTGPRRLRRIWLPIGRRGIEHEWHALRCAVYSPRPPAGEDAGDDPAFPE